MRQPDSVHVGGIQPTEAYDRAVLVVGGLVLAADGQEQKRDSTPRALRARGVLS